MGAANGFVTTSPDARYGDTDGLFSANVVGAGKFTCGGSGTLELLEIGAYLGDTGTDTNVVMAVYADDAVNGCPGELVADSTTSAIANTSGSYKKCSHTYSGTKPLITGGNDYWIAVFAEGDSYVSRFASGGVSVALLTGFTYPTLPVDDEWHAATDGTRDFSTYAVYQAASGFVPGQGALEFSGTTPVILVPFILEPAAGALSVGAPPRFMADLYCGTTRITSQEISPTSTLATTLLNLTDDERALITDWNDLELALTAHGRRVYVSWAGVETPGIGVSPDAGTMATAGVAPLPDLYGQEASVAGEMAFAGNAPTLAWDRRVYPATVALELDALFPALASPEAIAKGVDIGTLDLSGLVPVVLRDFSVFPDLAAMVAEGLAISPSTSHTIYPAVCAVVFAGEAPMPPGRAMRWSGETLALAGVAPGSFTVAGVTGGQLEYYA